MYIVTIVLLCLRRRGRIRIKKVRAESCPSKKTARTLCRFWPLARHAAGT